MNLNDVSVWIIDSSALIETKHVIPNRNQQNAYKQLEQMVVNGEIAIPRQVINEVTEITHLDMPAKWAKRIRGKLRHPLDVNSEYIKRVMCVAGDVVDPSKEKEDADPYVLALALQLMPEPTLFENFDVCIITEDKRNKGTHISMATACSRLDLKWCTVEEFLRFCGIATGKKKGTARS